MRTARVLAMPPPKQKPTTPILPRAIGPRLQPARGGHEILGHLRPVHFAEGGAALLVVAGIAADAGQSVGSEGDEIGRAQAARHIFDVRIESAIFVDHEDTRQFSRGLRRPNQISFDAAVAFRRRHGDVLGLDAAVVLGNLLRPGVIGTQALPDPHGRHAANREFLRAFQEIAALDFAVHIAVKQIQQLLRILARLPSLHWDIPPHQGKDITLDPVRVLYRV